MYKNDTGINAGAIWCLLSEKGELTIREIGEFTDFKEPFIYLALGWLLREDKIRFYDKNGVVYVELSHNTSDFYF